MIFRHLRIMLSYVRILGTVIRCCVAASCGCMTKHNATMRVCTRLVSENVLFTKCIQAASSHPMVPKEMHSILQTYTDSVPVRESDVDYFLLRNICSKHRVVVEARPRHSGMIAVVFYGTIVDTKRTDAKTPVVVKMVKTGVEAQILAGCAHLQLMRRIANGLSRFSANMGSIGDVLDVVIKSAGYLRQQCDLTHEQRAMRSVHDAWTELQPKYERTSSVCNRFNRIRVPRVLNEPDEPNAASFMIMEKVGGVPAFALRNQGVKRRGIALLQSFILSQALLLDYYHTDMHTGNVLFDYNEDDDALTVGIYDYGMHVKVGPDERIFLLNLLDTIMNHDSVKSKAFDAVHFIRLTFQVHDTFIINDTPTLRELIASLGKDIMKGGMSAESGQVFINSVSRALGITAQINDVPMQILLGTSMVNSITFELSDNNIPLLIEIGTEVYHDIVLS